MIRFEELYDIAAARKGGRDALETLIAEPKPAFELEAVGDDRYLAMMSRFIFQSGLNWKVVDTKWDGIEAAFEGFTPNRWAVMSDEDLDRLLKDPRIIRHAPKILSVRDNAVFLLDLKKDHGSAGAFFANHPPSQYIGLLELLKKRGNRMGGTTAQYFLRFAGVDSVIFSDHVTQALIREGVVDKKPTSKRDMEACQNAFNTWMDQANCSLTRISRVLAFTVDENHR